MPRRKRWSKVRRAAFDARRARRTRVVDTGRRGLPEPEPSTRLEMLKNALAEINFGFTIFFTDERGQSIKFYSGAVIQEEARG